MTRENMLDIVDERTYKYLVKQQFTGSLIFTIHSRDGGIGRLSLQINEELTKKELTKNEEGGILKESGYR